MKYDWGEIGIHEFIERLVFDEWCRKTFFFCDSIDYNHHKFLVIDTLFETQYVSDSKVLSLHNHHHFIDTRLI